MTNGWEKIDNWNYAVHIKTGNIYKVSSIAIDCTNARDGNKVVVYTRVGDKQRLVFVRDIDEFMDKFKPFSAEEFSSDSDE